MKVTRVFNAHKAVEVSMTAVTKTDWDVICRHRESLENIIIRQVSSHTYVHIILYRFVL
jgi:hypothetical protein